MTSVNAGLHAGFIWRQGTMVRMRILVVEDEHTLAVSIAKGLRRHAFAVDVAPDGAQAMKALDENDYDVAILDRDIPHVSGDDVCRHIVAEHPLTRTLMLTAAGDLNDRVAGLTMGADDYLAKPFAFPELVARTNALLRRTTASVPPVLAHCGVTLDPNRVEVFRDGHYVALTKKEFGVLHELMRSPGVVVSAEQLLDRVWDANIDPFTNVVRVVVMTLRRKLGQPTLIETVTGVGYRLCEPGA
jgi:DNA-binding response OmpR family regulator